MMTPGKSLALALVAGIVTATFSAFLFDRFARRREAEQQPSLIPQPIARGHGSV